MKVLVRLIVCIVILIADVHYSFAQEEIRFTIKGREVFQEIDLSIGTQALDSYLVELGFDTATIDLPKLGSTSLQDWVVVDVSGTTIFLKRNLASFDDMDLSPEQVHMEAKSDNVGNVDQSMSDFGYNTSVLSHIEELRNGNTRFRLNGFSHASEVYLSGNFCNWSTLKYPMERSPEGWVVEIDLEPGVWGYKFVVDGTWNLDPLNEDSYWDGYGSTWTWRKSDRAAVGNENSLYVKTNHVFELPGHLDAEQVKLAGSFTQWSEDGPELRKRSTGWILPVYLADGSHRYKFIVEESGWFGDDKWITDPLNPKQREDEMGNLNSVLELGEKVEFRLKGYEDANQVILTGDFIDWSERELRMIKQGEGWYLPYVLGPGNYSYKFIVDGKWITDPNNQVTIGKENYLNSVLVVEPNHRFELKGFQEAKQVLLSGSFNGWPTDGYTMIKREDSWELPLHLRNGKYQYKFVVDGVWMHDPSNPQKERNEYNEFNSVLWVE